MDSEHIKLEEDLIDLSKAIGSVDKTIGLLKNRLEEIHKKTNSIMFRLMEEREKFESYYEEKK